MHAAMRGHGIASTSGHDASVRAVEAGSRLVAAPRGADYAVLQLPRGNLETVSPRALVLAALADALLVSHCKISEPPSGLVMSSNHWSSSCFISWLH